MTPEAAGDEKRQENPAVAAQDDDVSVIGVDSPPKWRRLGCGPFTMTVDHSTYYLVLLSAIATLLFADQNLLSPVLSRVAQDLGFVERFENGTVIMEFDDRLNQMVPKVDKDARDKYIAGYITLAFFVIGGITSVFVGMLADSINRKWTFAAVVCLGEAFCIGTYWVTTYAGLLVTRSLTGIAMGGAVPLLYSLTSDLFSIENRGKAISAATISMGLGAGAGQILASLVAGEDRANWRTSFLVVAIPTYFLIALFVKTVDEPKRGQTEEALRVNDDVVVDYTEKLSSSKIKDLVKTPTALLIFATGIPGSLPWGIIIGFIPDFLIEEKNLDVALSGLVVLGFGIGAIPGAIFGGWAADKLHNRLRVIPLMMGTCTMLGTFPMWALLNLPPSSVWLYIVIMIPAGFFASVTGSAIRAILMNITVPEVRGTAFSILNLSDDIGKGAGVFAVSLIITAIGDRTQGLNIAMFGWIVSSFTLYVQWCFVKRDFDKAQERLVQARENAESLALENKANL